MHYYFYKIYQQDNGQMMT